MNEDAARRPPPPLHLLLAPLPGLFAYAQQTVTVTRAIELLPLALVTLAATLLLFGLFALLTRRARTSALAASLLVLVLTAQRPGADQLLFWLAVAVGVGLALAAKRIEGVLTTFANASLALLTLFGAVIWASHLQGQAAPFPRADRPVDQPAAQAARPDVWYLVLDGYGRPDLLAERYGLPDELTPFLRSRGFCVPEEARANYGQTMLSLASALNAAPLDELLTDVDEASRSRHALRELIADGRVVRAFRAAGHRLVVTEPEYAPLRQRAPDERLGPWPAFDDLTYHWLLSTSIPSLLQLAGAEQGRLGHALHRRHVRAVFDELQRGDRWDEPVFVFAHVLAPHPPFVFRADGGDRPNPLPAGLQDGSHWHAVGDPAGESYVEGYRAQAAFVTGRVRTIVDAILATSATPPVIVLQGDHGPGDRLDWADPAGSDARERLSILSAWRLPDGDCSEVTPGMTPINGWRLVLRRVLGLQLPPLPDRSFLSGWNEPYRLLELTPP